MIKGLLKSFFLHLLIVGLFIYGSEIFKNNKRFEINEIPLDIIDISDQTITKTEKKIKEKAAKKKQQKNQGGFQPPKVKSKPKPPEFAKKDNVTKKKKEIIKDNKEEQKQKKRVDNILKSIEKIKSEKKKQLAKTEDLEEEKDLDENKKEKSINLGEKLTISEKDAIRRQFYKCWIVPAGAKNIKDYKVSIRLKLNEEGEVIYSKIINNSQINNTFFRTLAESAVRAVNHPDCKRLKVPKKKYETWKETILDFDPSVMIN
tara:strand:- start:443 stop:1222 length:780 start_codon:yes stop_codon:yes gene_type:complete